MYQLIYLTKAITKCNVLVTNIGLYKLYAPGNIIVNLQGP
jgi:hypothetical protein